MRRHWRISCCPRRRTSSRRRAGWLPIEGLGARSWVLGVKRPAPGPLAPNTFWRGYGSGWWADAPEGGGGWRGGLGQVAQENRRRGEKGRAAVRGLHPQGGR